MSGICNFHAWALAAAGGTCRQMDRHLVLDWMKHHGVLCRPHAKRIRQLAAVRLHGAFEEVDGRAVSELDSELQELLSRSATGEKARAGVLERIVEFLMSQRGSGNGRILC